MPFPAIHLTGTYCYNERPITPHRACLIDGGTLRVCSRMQSPDAAASSRLRSGAPLGPDSLDHFSETRRSHSDPHRNSVDFCSVVAVLRTGPPQMGSSSKS